MFQRKLHKICSNWTTVHIVNLACFQSSWYLSSQALLQPAEKPLTLSLGDGPGRRLAQWLPGSCQVLISFPGEMTAEKSVKPFSGSSLFGQQQRELVGAGGSWQASGAGKERQAASWWPGLSEVNTALTLMQGDACLKGGRSPPHLSPCSWWWDGDLLSQDCELLFLCKHRK